MAVACQKCKTENPEVKPSIHFGENAHYEIAYKCVRCNNLITTNRQKNAPHMRGAKELINSVLV